jgi:hypothetical protein
MKRKKEIKSAGELIEENIQAFNAERKGKDNPIISFRSSSDLAQLIDLTALTLKLDRSEALRFILGRACRDILSQRPKAPEPEVQAAAENKTKGELLSERYMQRMLYGDWNKKKGVAYLSSWTEQ